MAAGDSFTLTPTVVIPHEPDYYNIITPSESMKKEYLNMSATAVKRWTIRIKVLTSDQMNTWLTHVNDNSGDYYKFTWTTVPPYVNSGANIDGRWVKGTWKATPITGGYWSCEAVFEKDN